MLGTKENLHTLTEIKLTKYKLWTIEGDRRGDVIRCLKGSLWITQAADLKDYILEAGEEFWVTKPGMVVVQALDDSQIKYILNKLQNHREVYRKPVREAPHSLR